MENGLLAQLSAREHQVIVLAADGSTDKEIAGEVGVSTGSIKTYWERIRRKLRANNRAHAVAVYVRLETMAKTSPEANLNNHSEDAPIALPMGG